LLIAWQQVSSWLSSEIVWTSQPTERHADVLGNLLALPGEHGNLVPDTHLAALANEHGLTLCSTDGDFARFPGLTWCDQALPPAISSRRIVIVETRPGPRMIATAGTGGRGANSGVQRAKHTRAMRSSHSGFRACLPCCVCAVRRPPISSLSYCLTNCSSFFPFSCSSQRSAALPRPVVSSVTVPFERTTMRVLTRRPRM
jgi:hypothetical protein